MSTHRRTTSDSIPKLTVYVPHALSFAGANDDDDRYFAAQRYDWANPPAKLTEPRAPYEPTQPFDYDLSKKRGRALGVVNVVGREEDGVGATYELLKKKMGRPRKLDARENQSPAVSVEPESIDKPAPKRRGRPPRRMVETSRKTDDGDNSEDESYVQPNESWKAGTKRRGSAPQHPPKRARMSRTVDTDEEQETGPLRSGGARSRATPIKPQQANRWSSTEDRQLIDSLFEVLGSIPWRRVTAFMADKGFSCADRGEGAIRGRWKVLRPRLYIAPPTVVRGAAAKSQLKAREREENATTRDEDEDEEMDVDPKEHITQPQHEHEPEPELERQAPLAEPGHVEVEGAGGGGGGDTTAEDDDVAAREADAERRELAQRRKVVPPLPVETVVEVLAPGPPTPPSILPPTPPSIAPPPPPRLPAPTQMATPNVPPRSPPPPLAFTSPTQPPPFQHSTPNVSKYGHYPSTTSSFVPGGRDHQSLVSPSGHTTRQLEPMLSSPSGHQILQLSPSGHQVQLSPSGRQAQLSPSGHQRQLSPQTSPHKLGSTSGRILPPPSTFVPAHITHPTTLSAPHQSNLPILHQTTLPAHQAALPVSLQSTLPASHQTNIQLPPAQSFLHEQVWPGGERSYERSPTREYDDVLERGGGRYVRGRGYEGSTYSERAYVPREERAQHVSREERVPHVSREERTQHVAREERVPHIPREERASHLPREERTTHLSREERVPHGYERTEPAERKSRKPEMLPFPLPPSTRRETYQYTPPSYQTSPSFSTQVFPPYTPGSSSGSGSVLFSTIGQSRLPVLAERTPSPKRKRTGRKGGGAVASSQETEVPDSTAGSSDGGR